MNKLKGELKVYSALLRLYPQAHRNRYGAQMLQTVADMLEGAPSTTERIAVWARIIIDLPLSVYKEHVQVIGENMHTQNNHRIKIGTIVGALAALIGAGFPVYNRVISAIGSADALRLPTPLSGFLFPTLALLIVGITFFIFKSSSPQKKAPIRRTWPIAAVAAIAIIDIAVLVFDLATRN